MPITKALREGRKKYFMLVATNRLKRFYPLRPTFDGEFTPAEIGIVYASLAGGTDNEVAEKLGLTRNYVSVTFGRIKERTGLNRSQVCYIFGLRESQRKHEMHKV